MNQDLSAVQHTIFSASYSSHSQDKGSHIHHIHTYISLKTVEIDATYFLPYSWYKNEVWWTTWTRLNTATTLFQANIYFFCLTWSHIVLVAPWFFCSLNLLSSASLIVLVSAHLATSINPFFICSDVWHYFISIPHPLISSTASLR